MECNACFCGELLAENKKCCRTCFESQQRRLYQHPIRSEAPTPPPSKIGPPRQSLDQKHPTKPAVRPTKPSAASSALDSAFACDEEQPNIWPASFYRSPSNRSRTSSSRGSISPDAPAAKVSNSMHSQDRLATTRPATPDAGIGGASVREYSPIAAGFARLSRKDPLYGDGARRSRSERSSVDLHARMFDGPA
ncbi:hypothetical protein M433DRAFT_505823 [Acidomyces richmondensis BFW]|nr:MAG: hypothetical protein FE78DRAFT_29411 [Acidomyces sp. 'richmondensis']KYG47285.1 hypothetical protein M433DRAFT_505823 [Acidomyces richmondensis BFW]